ncbi:MAG: HEAT repeat domain-containing protein [Deltaproteobacteria bacterium]|nr:HEAT repeat domain-containing protein [Deltaproteobacteria bacterium]
MSGISQEDDRIRRVEALAARPAAEALPALMAHLGDSSWRVRHAAVDALCTLPDPSAVAAALFDSLKDPEDTGRRNAALTALSRLGSAALPALCTVSAAPAADHRKLAVDALGMLGLPDACAALVARLVDPDTNVRAAAAEALGRVGTPEAVRALLDRLETAPPTDGLEVSAILLGLARARQAPRWSLLAPLLQEPLVRSAAITAVPYSQAPEAPSALVEALGSRLGTLRAAVLGALCAAGTAAPAVAALLRHASWRDELRRRAVELLGTRDEETAASAAAAASWVADTRTAAVLLTQRVGRPWDAAVAEALRRGGPDAGLLVAEMLRRMEPEDQALALELLEQHPDPRVVPHLQQLFPRVSNDLLERVARAWLAAEPVSALEPLARRTADPATEPEDRSLCQRALLDAAVSLPLAVHRAVSPLILPGAEQAPLVQVLARAAGPDDGPRFRGWLRHPDAEIRAAACEGLAAARTPDATDALLPLLVDELPAVRAAAARALGRLGAGAHLDALQSRVADEDPEVQRAALGALSALDLTRARSAILELAANAEPDRAEAALWAAESVGGELALAAGTRALSHPEVSVLRAALRTLGASLQEAASTTVTSYLRDPRWEVRHAAARAATALQEAGIAEAALARAAREVLAAEGDPLVREALQLLIGPAREAGA